MANEADVLELSGMNPIRFNCASGTSISKGTLLYISADHLVQASWADNQVYAGVAAMDKDTANGDVSDEISVHVPHSNNIFDMTLAASDITLGAMVCLSGANLIREAVAGDGEAGYVIGQALEAGTGSSAEVIRVRS